MYHRAFLAYIQIEEYQTMLRAHYWAKVDRTLLPLFSVSPGSYLNTTHGFNSLSDNMNVSHGCINSSSDNVDI